MNLICCFLLSLLPFSPVRQPVLILSSDKKEVESLPEYLYVLEDSTGTIGIDQILTEEFKSKFMLLKDFGEIPDSRNTYWLRLKVTTSGEQQSPFGLIIPKSNHLVDLFEVTDTIIYHQKTGLYVSGEQNREIIPFTNLIRLSNYRNACIFIKIRNTYDENPSFLLRIVNIPREIVKNNQKTETALSSSG